MRKKIAIVFACIMMLSMSACGGDATTTTEEISSVYQTEDITTTATEETVTSNQTSDKDLTEIDIFSDVQIKYDGWNEFGDIVEIRTDNCESLVCENVTFSLDSDYSELTNGDIVHLIAEYDDHVFSKNGFKVINNTKDYQVEGLREIITAQPYHEDVAWVKVKFADNTQWCCCDKNGNILFCLDVGSNPTTYFANGVAIVDHNRIVNKSGEVVWSIDSDGKRIGNELWGENNVELIKILFECGEEDYFGYTVVKFIGNSVDSTGIIDNKGNWYLEPDHYFFIYKYDRNGVYRYATDFLWNYVGVYNILENEFIDDIQINDNRDQRWHRDYELAKHDGLIFWFNLENYPGSLGLYNADGNKVIDLSKYDLIEDIDAPEFNEGYSLVEFENEQGSRCYTIIDTNGTEMFDPRESVEHGKLRCGYYWVENVGYMNVYGEVAFDISFIQGSDFNNDMAIVETLNSNIHYINTNGEIIY